MALCVIHRLVLWSKDVVIVLRDLGPSFEQSSKFVLTVAYKNQRGKGFSKKKWQHIHLKQVTIG